MLLVRVEQVVAPVEDVLEGPSRSASPAGEQLEPVGDALQQLCGRQDVAAGGGQFDRQGYTVETATQLEDGVAICVGVNRRVEGRRPLDEQSDRSP